MSTSSDRSRPSGASPPRALVLRGRRLLLVAAIIVVVASVAVALAVGTRPSDPVRVTTSSSAAGSHPSRLLGGPLQGRRPELARWRSDSAADGSWVRFAWGSSHRIGTAEVSVASPARSASAVIVTFDDGSAVHLTPDAHGVAAGVFPERSSRTVRFTVQAATGVGQVAFAGIALRRASLEGGSDSAAVVRASSARAGHPAVSVLDGDIASADRGGSWEAGPADRQPWVRISWPRPEAVDAVVLVGADDGDGAVRGALDFSDGSRVEVSGVESDGPPTTIAFMPRTVRSVSVRLERAGAGLGEVRVVRAGEEPPRWPSAASAGSPAPKADSCDPAAREPSTPSLSLACPSMGASVGDDPLVIVTAPPRSELVVSARSPADASGSSWNSITVGRTVSDAAGTGRLRLRLGQLPFGPVGLVVRSSLGSQLHVQLFHRRGARVEDPGHAPAGMTLQRDEDFTAPLSASESGKDTDYAARKPEAVGSGQFGEARFADPARSSSNIGSDSGFLRLALTPSLSGSGALTGALLSSLGTAGSGFSAQYGYFEARMLGAPGPGSWPAFWMLDSRSAVQESPLVSEVDAVEMYGHDVSSSCHSIHAWTDGEDSDVPSACVADDAFGDWALQWHTYAVRILPGTAVFSVDGKEVARRSGLHLEEQPMFFLVDLALGGGWPVDLSSTGDRTALYVDWIRVYT